MIPLQATPAGASVHISVPSVDWLAVAPLIALVAGALLIILLRSVVRRSPRVYFGSVVLAKLALVTAGVLLVIQWHVVSEDGPSSTLGGMFQLDQFGVFLSGVIVIAALLALLVSYDYLQREKLEGPEYFALILLSAAGMVAMTSANDLIVVFLALEILSIPLYVLAAFDRRRLASQEAGIKYFVLGAFSSAVLLYGIAMVYGATGTTSITGIADFLAKNTLLEQGALLVGIALLLVGIGFKIAAVPFHMWTPDVYQGSPTPVTVFMSSATKVAGFAMLLRVFLVGIPLFADTWRPAISGLAMLTIVTGSVLAIVQTDVKRMLAYSSISHAGYVLIGVAAAASTTGEAAERGLQSALLYLLVYSFMTIGAFTVVMVVARTTHDARHSLADYKQLATKRPVLAGLLAFFLLAQAGVPFTGGFVAKLEVFVAATDAHEYYLVIVGVLAAVVASYMYLRIVVTMFSTEGDAASAKRVPGRVDAAVAAALVITAGFTLAIGIAPGWFLHLAGDATLATLL